MPTILTMHPPSTSSSPADASNIANYHCAYKPFLTSIMDYGPCLLRRHLAIRDSAIASVLRTAGPPPKSTHIPPHYYPLSFRSPSDVLSSGGALYRDCQFDSLLICQFGESFICLVDYSRIAWLLNIATYYKDNNILILLICKQYKYRIYF